LAVKKGKGIKGEEAGQGRGIRKRRPQYLGDYDEGGGRRTIESPTMEDWFGGGTRRGRKRGTNVSNGMVSYGVDRKVK